MFFFFVFSSRQKEMEQVEALRKHHSEEIEHHKKEIERLQKEIDRHKGKIRRLKHDDWSWEASNHPLKKSMIFRCWLINLLLMKAGLHSDTMNTGGWEQ